MPEINTASVFVADAKKSGDLYRIKLAEALEQFGTSDAFKNLFGHLSEDTQSGIAFQLKMVSQEFNKSADDILEIMKNKDFKGAFSKLSTSAQFAAAAMVDNLGAAANQVLAILNEKDFRKSFGGLDAAVQISKANIILAGRDIQAMYDGAKKSIETLTKSIGDANDALKTAISTAAGVIDGMISAAQAVQTANAAVTTARHKEAEATKTLTDLQKDYARALADVISPINEIAVAERGLTRIRKSLTDLDREEIKLGKDNLKLQQDLADLQGQKTIDDRAALLRGEERAQINLNKAQQAEIDLLDKLNGKNKIAIDLTGLSLDQIREKLAAARLSSKARSGERDQTAQEIADSKATARLDVADAQQAVQDAKAASIKFESDTLEKIDATTTQIRDNNERIKAIGDDRKDQLLDEANAVRDISRLRAGETTQQKLIKDWDDKINAAKQTQKEAAQGIEAAVRNAAIEQATFRLKTAEARGDAEGILKAHQDLWNLQIGPGGLIGSNTVLRDIMHTQMQNVEKARDAARELVAELKKANATLGAAGALQGASSALGSFETLSSRVSTDLALDKPMNPITLGNITRMKNDVMSSLRAALGQGAAENKTTKQPEVLSGAKIDQIIREILAEPGNLRDAIARVLNKYNLSMPGFAAAHGYAPGDLIHHGMNDGVGVMRWAEWGKEAVLPLTRKLDMFRVVNDPSVLPKILDALPRWRMPTTTSDEDNSGLANDLSTIIGDRRSVGGPVNTGVDEKKSQREFAAAIGTAVKMAVMEALAESDGLGADVDINVMPSSGNEVLIAREVKRQVDKALGKRSI
jgi:hypothetical protein